MKHNVLSVFVLFACLVLLSACEPEMDSESDAGTATAADSGDDRLHGQIGWVKTG